MTEKLLISGLPEPKAAPELPQAAPAVPGRTRSSNPRRRKEEDLAGPDYPQRMLALGPRCGESYLSFRMRLAAIIEGRDVLRQALAGAGGSVTRACQTLGIQRTNFYSYLKRLGLRPEDIRSTE